MAKLTTVRARLVQANPDRSSYKPYNPTLEFSDVYVDIPVPQEYIQQEKGALVLEVEGLAILLDVVATALDDMNSRWKRDAQVNTKHFPYK